ncbi:RNA 2',3'-cyclic phosphodiesterase [Anaerocolumna sedimenticola]|uniref:RNA 2',3'-cyclic phosphodiesterase n=1 Tax=Anaerocolumna sedimenticola TaxID=2696063 RepID=A0A6P1TS43_9FIRM|nr:RNA 2',3'-cyclic phosphodiesterase [Anaerocolumna sedimenticola]QHQ63049.1 RNA 2',3'-cyclic phosphodiesterase [Anaerocolumna sedimenticola]
MKDLLRLFIAINFSDDIKLNLFQLTEILKKNTSRGHFTARENFHLTLAFIGETKDKEHVIEAIDNAVEKGKIHAFQLEFGGFGRFKGRDGDIFWVGVKKHPVLTESNNELIRELKTFEFKVDDKEFKPHLTLGRGIVLKNGYTIKDFEQIIPPMTMTVKEIGLMKSERINGRLVYTEVYHKNLL